MGELLLRPSVARLATIRPGEARIQQVLPEEGGLHSQPHRGGPTGMKVALDGRIVAFISGTASINEQGVVVHSGDIAGQVNRMLLNAELLVEADGATPGRHYLPDDLPKAAR